jgi:hypothetical protein
MLLTTVATKKFSVLADASSKKSTTKHQSKLNAIRSFELSKNEALLKVRRPIPNHHLNYTVITLRFLKELFT